MLVDNQLSLSFKNVLQLNRNLVVFQTKIYIMIVERQGLA